MYLKSRRYTTRRRRIRLWRVLLWLCAPVIIFVGIGLYQNRAIFIPLVNEFLESAAAEAGNTVATIQAGPPTATPDPTERITRAKSLWRQGSFHEAVNIYQEVIAALPNDVEAHYLLALGLIMEERYTEAVEAAEDAVTANPFESDAWAIRAMALNRVGDYGRSIASALRALELRPESARAHAFLGESYLDLGLIDRAILEIDRALELDADSFEAYYARSRINSETRFDFAAAKQDLEIAYDLSGGMTYIGILLAREEIFRQGGDPSAGLATLQEMNERNPNNPLVLSEIGRYYYRNQGDLNQASTYLNRCVTAVPTAITCHFWLGRVRWDAEEPELAADSFKQTVDLRTQNPQHYFWAGRSQIEGLGNCASGVIYLEDGYALARSQPNSEWLDDFEDYMQSAGSVCGVTFDSLPSAPPQANLELTPET